MAGFDVDPDRWLSRGRHSDDDLGAHPLFGAHHPGPAAAGGALFMDMRQGFNHGDRQCSDDDFHERRAVHHLDMDDDGDDVLIARGVSRRDDESLSAAPPSQQYTEAASTQTLPSQSSLQHYSQESSDSSANPAKLRTDEFLGFWAHKVQPRPMPPTPQLQRTTAICDESPSALVDGIVRAGLDTPGRPLDGHFARPATGFSSFGGDASSTTGTIRSVGASTSAPYDKDSPASTMSGEKRPNVQYRTVQQYLSETNGGQSPSAAAAGGGFGRGVSSRPMAPAPAGAASRNDSPIVILEFKMDRRRRFRCSYEIAPQLKPDDWVVVQLDNGGVDMGACIEVHQPSERMMIPRHYGHGECGTVLRLADEDDCRVLNETIPEKEELALAKAHQLVHFLHMPFTCIDAEFQFDLKAVNLYYTLTPQQFTSIMPNVSRLQRELGFLLKAKVHLEQLVPVDG